MKEPQGFLAANDYTKSIIQEDGFYMLTFVTPSGIEGHYQFTIQHNVPSEAIPNLLFNVIGNLYNSTKDSEGEVK